MSHSNLQQAFNSIDVTSQSQIDALKSQYPGMVGQLVQQKLLKMITEKEITSPEQIPGEYRKFLAPHLIQ